MFSRTARSLFALTALAACTTAAQSAALTVSSYDMPNGDGQAQGGTYNSYNYWDGTYTGSGDTTRDGLSGSFLQGGTGALTDGVIATAPWYDVSKTDGTGEYVGWRASPTITFHFANPVTINTITLYVDNSNEGGVNPPSAVVVDGKRFDSSNYPLDFPQSQPITLSGLDVVGNAVTVTLVDPDYWVFLSEVRFDGFTTAVPEAGNLTMMLAGLGLLGWASRRRA
jgi:hypothetical protein